MKCRKESDVLMTSWVLFDGIIGLCGHKFCQICFKKKNTNPASHLGNIFNCPCCHAPFYENMQSIDEAILFGEAANMRTFLSRYISLPRSSVIPAPDVIAIDAISKSAVQKLEAAFMLNPANFDSLYSLFRACSRGHWFYIRHKDRTSAFYCLRIFKYAHNVLDHPTASERDRSVTIECYYDIASVFGAYCNYSAALKYSKLAYEHRLRSSDHSQLSISKGLYLEYRADFSKLPPLRFAVGDEVEFLHEIETGSEWKLGKVVELYYREREFDIAFTAPYRLQLLDDSGEPPVYAWVKADIDRYVRKVGVRSIEDTRYQARLDAKVAELAHVYCSKEFIQDIYLTLSQDHEFVDMLQSVWEIELSEDMLGRYRLFVMYRQPLIRTDSGYHVSSIEEVISEIKAYFDPAHLSDDAVPSAAGEETRDDSRRVRVEILEILRGNYVDKADAIGKSDFQGQLLRSILNYLAVLPTSNPLDYSRLGVSDNFESYVDEGDDFAVPSELSDSVSKVSTAHQIRHLNFYHGKRLEHYLDAWIALHSCLENPDVGSACECPFVYYFVKFCLDHGTGVPKLALAMYDRTNIQLSREFIRCANRTCELTKLDKSTGQVKFKQCSRCLAVIYCSRECQVAHYPEHKRLCRAHSTG